MLVLALAVGLIAASDPALGLIAAVGVVLVATVLINLTAGVCVFVVLTFIDFLPTLGGTALSFTKLVGILLALSWLAALSIGDEARRNFFSAQPALAYAAILFLGWVAISVLWADVGGRSGDAAVRYGLNLLLFPIVFAAVVRREHLVWVTIAFVIGATGAAVYGLPDAGSSDRLVGTVGDPNLLATSLVAGLVLATGLAVVARQGSGARFAAIAAAVICGIGIFLTLSRGGLVALGAVLLVGIILAGRRRGATLLLAVLLLLSAVTYYAALATPEARERVMTVSDGGAARDDVWRVGWRMVKANPVQGVGAGNFQDVSVRYLLEPGRIERTDVIVDRPRVAHNTYLQMLAELGTIGAVLFGLVVLLALGSGLRAMRLAARAGDKLVEVLARTILVANAGVLVAAFFLSANYSNHLWFLLALGPPLLAIASRSTQPQARDAP